MSPLVVYSLIQVIRVRSSLILVWPTLTLTERLSPPTQDKDVARLQDFQELEVVLEKAEGLSLFSGPGGLTDRPCYNMTASRLTY